MFSNKSSHILKKLIVYVSMYDLLLTTIIKGFKKDLIFKEFKILAFREAF